MTVAELIQELSGYTGDLPVLLFNNEWDDYESVEGTALIGFPAVCVGKTRSDHY